MASESLDDSTRDRGLTTPEVDALKSKALSGRRGVECCRNAAAELSKDLARDVAQVIQLYFEQWVGEKPTGRIGKQEVKGPTIITPTSDEIVIEGRRSSGGLVGLNPEYPEVIRDRGSGNDIGMIAFVPTFTLAPAVIETVLGAIATAGVLVGTFAAGWNEKYFWTVREKPNATSLNTLVQGVIRNRTLRSRTLCERCIEKALWNQSKKLIKLTKTARFREG